MRRRAGPRFPALASSPCLPGWDAHWNQVFPQHPGRASAPLLGVFLWGYMGSSSNTWEHRPCLSEGPPGQGAGVGRLFNPPVSRTPDPEIHLAADPGKPGVGQAGDSTRYCKQEDRISAGFLVPPSSWPMPAPVCIPPRQTGRACQSWKPGTSCLLNAALQLTLLNPGQVL